MTGNLEPVPISLLLPNDGVVRIPEPSTEGGFLVTPDELFLQLSYGNHNPGYDHANSPRVVTEHLNAWRSHVIGTDQSIVNHAPELLGSHVTNTIARVALVPPDLRSATFSLKRVYKQEEERFPRQGTGRDPEIFGVLYNSLKLILSKGIRQPRLKTPVVS